MTIVSQNGLPEYSLGSELLPSFGESHWISGLGNRDLMSHVKQVPPIWGRVQKFQRLKPPPKETLERPDGSPALRKPEFQIKKEKRRAQPRDSGEGGR
jgi:hypothetical protein